MSFAKSVFSFEIHHMGDKLLLTGSNEEMLDLFMFLEEIKVKQNKVYEQIQMLVVELIKSINSLPNTVAKHELKYKKGDPKECTLTMGNHIYSQ